MFRKDNRLYIITIRWRGTSYKGFRLEEGKFRLDAGKKFYTVKVLRHRLLSSCRCLILGAAQGHAGWGTGQPGLLGGVPAQGRGLGLDRL